MLSLMAPVFFFCVTSVVISSGPFAPLHIIYKDWRTDSFMFDKALTTRLFGSNSY